MERIGNIDIKYLAENFGTPLYVYDYDIIKNNYLKLKLAFDKYYPKNTIHYSVKANSNLNILKVFKDLDCGADCSSPFELFLAKKVGFESNKILYTGNYESIEDLTVAADFNVKINIDDINSFKRLIKIKQPEIISFRINPGIGRGGFEGIVTAGSDAKFGVPYEQAFEAYKLAIDSGIKRFGIHMMTGSNNLEPYYFAEVVDKLLTIAGNVFTKLDIAPEFIDIGGGFGIPYDDDEEELNIEVTARLVSETLNEKSKKYHFGEPELKMEPGRYLIGNAGYLISKVTGIKNSYKRFIGIDAGMNVLIRPALYGAKHRIKIYGKSERKNFYYVCGQICENSDIMARHIYLPEVEEGDFAIIFDVGAYGFSMSSNYNNRMRPAEILIKDEKAHLIRTRETYEDILKFMDFD